MRPDFALSAVPICPDCGKATNQQLRGWRRGHYTSYRCGHCNKAYKVREDREDTVKSSQLGFKINDEEAEI